ncbi:hypothetical protein BLX24_23220 [Arsenicibacter rosenii]|uniref:Galactose oxidase n=2 Tax=Arsenicibacter rosenii TaxID=1750698 RepID=A0A1S2VDI6_9BACT|nr:hypothetical protein BLX24_23220 [Arsenicibacter rosenii]
MLSCSAVAQRTFSVKKLPPIPDADGFAGSLAGVSNGALVVAGGSNFPNGGRPWRGDTKKWYDRILVLESPDGQWKEAGKLPFPLGYAVTVSWKDAVVCVGGSNEKGHVAAAFLMRWKKQQIGFEPLPAFPHPIANACGALVGNVLYVAGGLEKPDATQTLRQFYALDLAAPNRTWQPLPVWEGAGRMLSVAAGSGNRFFLFSGTDLVQDKTTGTASRVYLTDAHVFDISKKQWTRLPDMPHPTVAAVGPALVRDGQVVIFGGDTGEYASQTQVLKDNHPGFSTDILALPLPAGPWMIRQKFPAVIRPDAASNPNASTYLPVTTPLVPWKGGFVMPGGEARPGTRTPGVLWFK